MTGVAASHFRSHLKFIDNNSRHHGSPHISPLSLPSLGSSQPWGAIPQLSTSWLAMGELKWIWVGVSSEF